MSADPATSSAARVNPSDANGCADPNQPRPARAAMRHEAVLLSDRERAIVSALAEAVMPAGHGIQGGGVVTIDRLERFLSGGSRPFVDGVRAGLWSTELATLPRYGRPLSKLPLERRRRVVTAWNRSPSRVRRWWLRAILTPVKAAHFDDPTLFEQVGCAYGGQPVVQSEPDRWMQQVTNGREVDEDLELECEVVVVGTGAGGAAAAHELAKRGRAVLMVEQGDFFQRPDFVGRASPSYQKMYLGGGATVALGNIFAPVWAGRTVGGSTTINSGTCYRAPEWTLRRWAERYGLSMLSSAALAPYFERAEQMLEVDAAPAEHLGGPARIVARGAAALGLSHQPILRNAPGCDGQGVCCFGCPTGAKRSTDVSYVPQALQRGAQLITGATVERVDVVAGRARGVTARLRSGRRLTVRAEVVVVAAGALLTPGLLRQSGLCGTSGWLGKNLSIHPASKVMGLFDEDIDMSTGIPQSYSIDDYAEEGLMFEGGSTPVDVTALAIPWVGDRFMDLMARYRHLATFGFMLQDKSRGEVRGGAGGLPTILYQQSAEDRARMQRGLATLCEVFLEAGATRVLPMVVGCEEVSSRADIERLRTMTLRGGDFEITAFHPLGTCRMGTDPARSCLGPDQEAHDTAGLYVTDGSAIPSSLGANPQMTIMALALRTAEIIDDRLDSMAALPPASRHRVPANDVSAPEEDAAGALGFEFHETMTGSYEREDEPGKPRSLSFTLRAHAPSLRGFLGHREVAIEGTVTAAGLANDQPLTGTLGLDVLATGRLPYAFDFTSDDGHHYRFAGQKILRLTRLRQTMTTLPAALFDDDGRLVARAELFFDLDGDLGAFLRSWRLRRSDD
ncbi:MAG: GMC family oxidoreductase [Deltaproteobacteria bacterium]|nr:GMC family oxidoreductase [Deltaproteobacteria bacterium]